MSARRPLALAGLCLALAACGQGPLEIDRFPIGLADASLPGVLLGLDDAAPVPAVVDTAAPQTLFDLGPDAPRLRRGDVTVYAAPQSVARARFRDTPLTSAPLVGAGLVSGGAAPSPLGAVLGADVLSQWAVRLNLRAHQLFFAPSLAGTDALYGRDCAAVLPSPPAGGGTVVVGGNERTFSPTRLVVGACASLYAERIGVRRSGVDLSLVVATSVEPLVLSRSAYARATGAPLPADALAASLYLPGATRPVAVHMGTLSKLTLVGHSNQDVGPCDEAWIALHTAVGGCCRGPGCPCLVNDTTCKAPATVELCGALPVAVVEDTEPFLQALRDELRPGHADVDGLLGTNALGALVTDLDYPGDRMIFDCQVALPTGVSRCTILPRAHSPAQFAEVAHCIAPVGACEDLTTFPAAITCPAPDPAPPPPPQ